MPLECQRSDQLQCQLPVLMRFADNLLRMGSVDEMERFEMFELATGAFCHHIEEAPPSWRNPAADYDIYDEASGPDRQPQRKPGISSRIRYEAGTYGVLRPDPRSRGR